MRYVYFTKTLKDLDPKGLVAFCKDTGLDGVDLAVRPGYPVHPDNAVAELPAVAGRFRDAGLTVGLVSASTDLNDPASKAAGALFEAAAKAGVPAVKLGYFGYKPPFDDALKLARQRLDGFAKLAAAHKVKACYHTHSGNYLGANASGLRLLLPDADPHHVGVFFDTGHTAIGGNPVRMEVEMVKPWLALVAIKDMAWHKTPAQVWKHDVVPAGEGIVVWKDVGQALKDAKFTGTVSLHGEYAAKDLDERKNLAKQELAFLKKHFA